VANVGKELKMNVNNRQKSTKGWLIENCGDSKCG